MAGVMALSTGVDVRCHRQQQRSAVRGESLSGPAPRRIGIRDVAQRAGVAISTVSKVFSGRGEVMPALRARVLAAAAELGYQPNYIAQSLRRGATDLIGFVASDLSDPFSAEIVAGAEYVLRPAGYALLVMSSNHDPDTDAANVRYLNSRRVDAILVSPSREDDRGLLAALAEFDGPIVALESELRGAPCRSTRSAPIIAAGCERRSSIWSGSAIAGSPRLPARSCAGPAASVLAGLLEGLRAHGLEDRALPIATEHEADDAEAEVLQMLDGAGAADGPSRRRPAAPHRDDAGDRSPRPRRSVATSRWSAGTTARSPSSRTRRSRSSTATRAASGRRRPRRCASPPRPWRRAR